MKIVIDDKIPYIRGAFEPFAEVVYLPGSKTTPDVVKDADAIVTRTRTKCNRGLLEGSKVKFIATATIGFDHIDTDYCREAGIEWTNAPGCNAESVNQYIASALFSYAQKNKFELSGKTIGVVGVGHVGSKVARLCQTIGMKVLLNDPPRERVEGPEKFASLKKIQEKADMITFHVPLNMKGEDATFHLVNDEFIGNLQKKPLLINSCRGEVFDTKAVKTGLKTEAVSDVIIDCWENEPQIDPELLSMAAFATPHIAGYSKDGKANGTKMSVQAISRFFKLGIDNWEPENVELPDETVIEIDGSRRSGFSVLQEAVLATYSIESDNNALRKDPAQFEKLRGDYPVRREFPTYLVKTKNVDNETADKLEELKFNILTE
ncbi:erythronate-4-phosphate dehydrogenase [Mariniphaga anaerophila]|uniref:Erythronate-4-phosphate dehydrogenase n=1 Tax=Mariniphaga anaerophila TaxID=1484053 RepID=A0A1M4VMV3_9BACT|nr:4-phosphoerythronate dehydrogenase PdxB [Mariniphaga anaerophila]SHE70238.1 erythronate-4-phosphate dehydrogenase [Mariniphaga anaerophila]